LSEKTAVIKKKRPGTSGWIRGVNRGVMGGWEKKRSRMLGKDGMSVRGSSEKTLRQKRKKERGGRELGKGQGNT